jgi:hypothetical protein
VVTALSHHTAVSSKSKEKADFMKYKQVVEGLLAAS